MSSPTAKDEPLPETQIDISPDEAAALTTAEQTNYQTIPPRVEKKPRSLTPDDFTQPLLARCTSSSLPNFRAWLRQFLKFVGPGYLVAVGYMDPGNWATDLEGGSRFGYTLLSVIMISNLIAMLLQSLAGKLGIVTGMDLAQACRNRYSKPITIILWLLCEIAIIATDLAELIGSAIALNLLFHIPLVWGIILTAFDVFILLLFQHKGFRYIEAFIMFLILVIGLCFLTEMILAKPDLMDILKGFIPKPEIVTNPTMLYIAIGILGATVMPHNLYLHSSIVKSREYEQTDEGKRQAVRFVILDSTIALFLALFINAAILILAAATFYRAGKVVTDISLAYEMLAPLLGTSAASILFGVALLASGQNSTFTGTLAGQIVMEGFLDLKLWPWARRLLTRFLAITPAVVVTIIYGSTGVTKLLVLSQVILSAQLPFAVVPLVQFTCNHEMMGIFASALWLKILSWLVAFIIAGLNIFLFVQICVA